jgi:hypothetical protein
MLIVVPVVVLPVCPQDIGWLVTLSNIMRNSKRQEALVAKKDKRNKKERKTKNKRDEKTARAPKTNNKSDQKTKAPEKEVWFTDLSAEAKQKRKEAERSARTELNPKVEAILEAARLENKEDSCTTLLQVFLASGDRNVLEITSEVQRLKLAHNLDDPKAIKVVLESILDFSDIKSVSGQFTAHAALLQHFARKHPSVFMGCIEELVGVIQPRLLPRTPIILKALFDAEIVSDQELIIWYELSSESSWLVNKSVAAEVRRRAEPLIGWLRDVDSDEESDESEDDS